MQNPKFSIIIPIYNAQEFIANALQSAIKQSFKDIEIICVDDCGADKSMDIVREFVVRDSRVKIVQNPRNLGTFETRNQGAYKAKGEYLFFLDSDDYLHADTCLKCFEFLQKDEQGFDFIMFNLLAQDSKNGDFTLRRVVNKSQITDTHGFEALYFGKDTNFYNVATKCIRKSTYLKAIAFAEVKEKILVAEDILASMALLGVSKRIALLDEALYYYRFNEGSATRAKDKKQERVDDLNLVISYFERLATKGDRAYEIFIQGLILVLHGHIFGNEMELLSDLYQARLASGCPKFIAKLLLSSGKKRHFKGQDKTLKRRLREFVEENKDVFLGES